MKWTKERIDEFGYLGTRVVLKSDQEESIKSLKRAIAVKRQADTVMIESPVRDPKSNGCVERAVRTWAAQVRTLRHHLESRLRSEGAEDVSSDDMVGRLVGGRDQPI